MRDIHSIGQAFKIVGGGTAKGSSGTANERLKLSREFVSASQEFPPQSKEKLREMFAQSISNDFEKGYKIVDTMINGYKQQAREETLREIPCPQMTNSSISECVCEWCKSFKEEKLGEGEKK